MHAKPIKGPAQDSGSIITHGIAKGRSSIPDSPESAGFLEAIKEIQENRADARARNSPAAAKPHFDNLIVGIHITYSSIMSLVHMFLLVFLV
jgi:hypothetical protein